MDRGELLERIMGMQNAQSLFADYAKASYPKDIGRARLFADLMRKAADEGGKLRRSFNALQAIVR